MILALQLLAGSLLVALALLACVFATVVPGLPTYINRALAESWKWTRERS